MANKSRPLTVEDDLLRIGAISLNEAKAVHRKRLLSEGVEATDVDAQVEVAFEWAKPEGSDGEKPADDSASAAPEAEKPAAEKPAAEKPAAEPSKPVAPKPAPEMKDSEAEDEEDDEEDDEEEADSESMGESYDEESDESREGIEADDEAKIKKADEAIEAFYALDDDGYRQLTLEHTLALLDAYAVIDEATRISSAHGIKRYHVKHSKRMSQLAKLSHRGSAANIRKRNQKHKDAQGRPMFAGRKRLHGSLERQAAALRSPAKTNMGAARKYMNIKSKMHENESLDALEAQLESFESDDAEIVESAVSQIENSFNKLRLVAGELAEQVGLFTVEESKQNGDELSEDHELVKVGLFFENLKELADNQLRAFMRGELSEDDATDDISRLYEAIQNGLTKMDNLGLTME